MLFCGGGAEHNLAWLREHDYSGDLRFLHADVRDFDIVREAVSGVEVIYHLAAQVAVTSSVDDPRTDYEINALGTLNVLEAARLSGRRPTVVFTSTNKVYGCLDDVAIEEKNTAYEFRDFPHGTPESQPLDFHSPYGCSKGAADQYVRDYARIYNLPTVVFRMSCIYGPRQFGNEDQGWLAHFMIAALTGNPITIYGNGKQVRDVLFVGHLVRALRLAAEKIDDHAVIFIFEWTTQLRFGDTLDLSRIIGQVPRERRFVIDCDGAYNERVSAGPDYNHRDDASSRQWMEICDSLSDRIFQPTYHPARPNVRPFLFHAYDPAWERPLELRGKEYGMVYVGHSKFRYGPMQRVLRAVEPIRERFGRIALVGHGWDAMPPWASWMNIEDYFYTDQDYLKKMGVEFVQPVPFAEVIDWMSKGIISPVIYRPLFSHLRLVTCRTFETPAANTIPLFGLDESYVREIYGERAVELVMPEEGAEEKVADIVRRPEHYAEIVLGIRKHLAERHSYAARIQELAQLVTD